MACYRHARSKTNHPETNRRRLLTPPGSFWLPGFSACIRARRFACGTGVLQRPFARPQRLPLSRPPLRGQRSWPATSKHHRASLKPVRLSAFAGNPLPPAKRDNQLACRVSTPHKRPFDLLRIEAFNPVRCRTVRHPQRPDIPSLPAATLLKIVRTADQRSRLGIASEARCSSNLLEPFSICP